MVVGYLVGGWVDDFDGYKGFLLGRFLLCVVGCELGVVGVVDGLCIQLLFCCVSCRLCWCCFLVWVLMYQLIIVVIDIVDISSVVSVLIFGLMFMCIDVNIFIGSVVEFGVVMKLVIIMLFSDRVNVSSQFVISVGVMIGRVMWVNMVSWLVFRFIVVFFSDRFIFCRCEDIIMVMKYRVKVMCVIQMVVRLCVGKFGIVFIEVSSVISEKFRIIFGIISGVVISVLNSGLLWKCLKWVIIIVVSVFSMVVVQVVQNVIIRLVYIVFISVWLVNRLLQVWVENLVQIIVSCELLNEQNINSRIGRYRKVKLSSSMFSVKFLLVCGFMFVFFLVGVVGNG